MKKNICCKCGSELEKDEFMDDVYKSIGINPDSFNMDNALCIECTKKANKKACEMVEKESK